MLLLAQSGVSFLRSGHAPPLPLLLHCIAVNNIDSPEISLEDGNESVKCEVRGSAERQVRDGAVQAGDVVSITSFHLVQESVEIEGMELVSRSQDLVRRGFEQLQGLPPNSLADVRARVTAVGDTGLFQSSFGRKHFFNLGLIDADGAEAIATFFDEEVRKFDRFFLEGHVYEFKKMLVDFKSKRRTARFSFGLTATNDADIRELKYSDGFPLISYNFTPFSDLTRLREDTVVDVVGVLTVVNDLQRGERCTWRVLELVDSESNRAEVKLWNAMAEQDLDSHKGKQEVLIVKHALVSDPGTHKLGTAENLSKLLFNPSGLPEVDKLLRWKASIPQAPGEYIPIQQSRSDVFNPVLPMSVSLSAEPHTIEEMQQITLLESVGQRIPIILKISLVQFKELADLMYPGCASVRCTKGVRRDANGTYSCSKCGQVSRTFISRYRIRMELSDAKNTVTATAFNDIGKQLLGITADALKRIDPEDAIAKVKSIEKRVYNFVLERNTHDFQAAKGYIIKTAKLIPSFECGID